jgi:hypothetical protein
VSIIADVPEARREAPTRNEYVELKRLVEASGLLNPRPHYFVAKIAVSAVLLGLGLCGLRLASLGPWWSLADSVLLSFVFVQIAMLGHDVVHLPNDLSHDPNANILFLVCTPEQARSRPRWVALDQPSPGRTAGADLCSRVLQHALPESGVRISPSIRLRPGRTLAPCGSLCGVRHRACRGSRTRRTRGAGGFLREQVLTARNIYGNWFIDFMYGGLNYQIEHHLFPSMPRYSLRPCSSHCSHVLPDAGHPVLRDQPGAVVARDRGPLWRSQPRASHMTVYGAMAWRAARLGLVYGFVHAGEIRRSSEMHAIPGSL